MPLLQVVQVNHDMHMFNIIIRISLLKTTTVANHDLFQKKEKKTSAYNLNLARDALNKCYIA